MNDANNLLREKYIKQQSEAQQIPIENHIVKIVGIKRNDIKMEVKT